MCGFESHLRHSPPNGRELGVSDSVEQERRKRQSHKSTPTFRGSTEVPWAVIGRVVPAFAPGQDALTHRLGGVFLPSSCPDMPRGTPLPENRPGSSVKPLKALRLKRKELMDRLSATKRHALSPLPDLAWHKGDPNDLAALVHTVHMTRHKREGTTRGKELLWVDGEHEGLRLFKTRGERIRAVPVRPVAAVQMDLVKIDPAYHPGHCKLRREEMALALQMQGDGSGRPRRRESGCRAHGVPLLPCVGSAQPFDQRGFAGVQGTGFKFWGPKTGKQALQRGGIPTSCLHSPLRERQIREPDRIR